MMCTYRSGDLEAQARRSALEKSLSPVEGYVASRTISLQLLEPPRTRRIGVGPLALAKVIPGKPHDAASADEAS